MIASIRAARGKAFTVRGEWLADALDAAVAAAYGWSADTSDDEVLRELLTINGGGR